MFVFFVVQREENKTNDNWNFWFCFYLSKNGRFVTVICFFKNWFAETPIFTVFLGAHFGAKLSKRGMFGPPQNKNKTFN